MLEAAGGWGELTAALAAFLFSHSLPARPRVRRWLVAVTGRRAYLVAYSALSLAILGWLLSAAARAPFVELWPRADWQAAVPVVAMLLASMLLVFGLTAANPLSLGLRWSRPFDPDRPGVAGFVRHPVLWATLLWSISHVVPNGDVAHVAVFGTFAAISVGGMLVLDRRLRRKLGADAWQALSRRTSNLPFGSLAKGWRPQPSASDLLKAAFGFAAYAALFVSHALIAGVAVPI